MKNGIVWDITPRKNVLHAWHEFLYLEVANCHGTTFQRVDQSTSSHCWSFSCSLCLCLIHVLLYKMAVYFGFYLSTVLVNPLFVFCWAPDTVSGGSVGMCSSVTLELGTQVELESMCLGLNMWTLSMDSEWGANASLISLGLGCSEPFLQLAVVMFLPCMTSKKKKKSWWDLDLFSEIVE